MSPYPFVDGKPREFPPATAAENARFLAKWVLRTNDFLVPDPDEEIKQVWTEVAPGVASTKNWWLEGEVAPLPSDHFMNHTMCRLLDTARVHNTAEFIKQDVVRVDHGHHFVVEDGGVGAEEGCVGEVVLVVLPVGTLHAAIRVGEVVRTIEGAVIGFVPRGTAYEIQAQDATCGVLVARAAVRGRMLAPGESQGKVYHRTD
jgi:hypothetical protein